jgi:hypothetical protein
LEGSVNGWWLRAAAREDTSDVSAIFDAGDAHTIAAVFFYGDSRWHFIHNGGRMAQRIRSALGVILIAALAYISGATYAQSRGSEWKMYGAVNFGTAGGEQRLFFDAASVVRRNMGHVEVWTNTLSQEALDDAEASRSKKIVDSAAEKKVGGYRPPLARVNDVDDDTVTQIIADETTADLAGIEPTMQILYELDCPNRLLRDLSVHLFVNGKPQTKETPSEWKHVPPEGSTANLLKILCLGQ